jgi:hypothetical protein
VLRLASGVGFKPEGTPTSSAYRLCHSTHTLPYALVDLMVVPISAWYGDKVQSTSMGPLRFMLPLLDWFVPPSHLSVTLLAHSLHVETRLQWRLSLG